MHSMKFVYILALSIFFSQCADLANLLQKGSIENPKVRVTNTKLAGLSFEQADLVFDIEIKNPNPVGISLTGFDYDLLLNNKSFLKGDQNKQIEMKANDVSTIQIPLSLIYDNIFRTYNSLKNVARHQLGDARVVALAIGVDQFWRFSINKDPGHCSSIT